MVYCYAQCIRLSISSLPPLVSFISTHPLSFYPSSPRLSKLRSHPQIALHFFQFAISDLAFAPDLRSRHLFLDPRRHRPPRPCEGDIRPSDLLQLLRRGDLLRLRSGSVRSVEREWRHGMLEKGSEQPENQSEFVDQNLEDYDTQNKPGDIESEVSTIKLEFEQTPGRTISSVSRKYGRKSLTMRVGSNPCDQATPGSD